MGLITQIASRFVFSGSKRSEASDSVAHRFVSFIAAISIAGLALGVTALLVVTSVMNGFERELKRALTGFHGHIILFSRAEPVSDPERFLAEIPKQFPEITAISPYIFAEAMLSSEKGVAGTVVEGIHRPSFDQVSLVGKKIISGRLPVAQTGQNPEITLGTEIARKLHLKVGDTVVLTIPFAKGADAPLVQKLKVVGLVKIGMYEYDSKYCLMEISELQKVLSIPAKVNAFKILTKNMDDSAKITAALNDKYIYPLRAKDWSSLNRNLFYAIRHQKAVIGIILTAIILVASFNIISTLVMMVHDKKRQISILKALGWSSKKTFAVFLLIGAALSISGTFLGLGFGRALCAIVQWKSIVDLPPDIYMFSKLPVEIRPVEWVLIASITIALAVFSTLLPSWQVGKQSPVEGLRYD